MRASLRGAAAASVGAALLLPPTALGEVNVQMDGTTLVVEGVTVERARFRLEHFRDASAAGGGDLRDRRLDATRVRQLATGDPTIRSNDSDCAHNPFLNDVVCEPFPASGRISLTNADDRVEIGGSSGVASGGCRARAAVPFAVDLAGGHDVLVTGGFDCQDGFETLRPRFHPLASGGDGNDILVGGHFADTLEGGLGADSLNGEGGLDTVTYEHWNAFDLTVGVSVTFDGAANDGLPGEGDNLLSVENVVGTRAGDDMTGSSAANRFRGEAGNDDLKGAGGNDILGGGPGEDELSGGSGDDTIAAVDGTPDRISCLGGNDTVEADIRDEVPTTPPGSTSTLFCENVEQSPVDGGTPGRIVQRSVRVSRTQLVRLRIRCPRSARVACRGKLRLVGRGGRVLARSRYRVSRRQTDPLWLRLTRPAVASVRRHRWVLARTLERSASSKGRRWTYRRLSVR